MSNLKEKFDKRFSKVQDGIDKGRGKVELVKEKSNLNKEINEAQLKKTNVLLEMGELLYTKLRKSEIEESDFDKYFEQIINLDKCIYDNLIKIKELEDSQKDTICYCGHIINTNDKFCAECGNKIHIEEVKEEGIVCNHCNSESSKDSKYCECCGFELK